MYHKSYYDVVVNILIYV